MRQLVQLTVGDPVFLRQRCWCRNNPLICSQIKISPRLHLHRIVAETCQDENCPVSASARLRRNGRGLAEVFQVIARMQQTQQLTQLRQCKTASGLHLVNALEQVMVALSAKLQDRPAEKVEMHCHLSGPANRSGDYGLRACPAVTTADITFMTAALGSDWVAHMDTSERAAIS